MLEIGNNGVDIFLKEIVVDRIKTMQVKNLVMIERCQKSPCL